MYLMQLDKNKDFLKLIEMHVPYILYYQVTFKISKGANTIRPAAQSSLTLHKKICLFLGLNECIIIGRIQHTHHSLVPKSRFLNTFANHY